MDTKKLRQKILDLAIRGKLVPQDPNDEPASVLLERIRAEKERLIKEGKIKRSKQSASDTPHYENVAPFEIPDSWEWTTIGDIFQHNTGKALNKSDHQIGILKSYLTTSNVYWNSFDFTDVKQMYFKDSELEKCTISKGDLLVCEGGDIGRAAIWEYDDEICIQNHLHRLRAYRTINQRLYLYVLMLYKWTERINGKGIGLQGLSSGLLDQLIVPLPPYDEQNRTVSSIEQWFSIVNRLDVEKTDLSISIQNAKSKILDLAIHGKLVPQNPNDEPAIDLLRRINPKFEPCDNAHYPFGVPSSWQWIYLEHISTDSSDGPFGSNLKKEHYTTRQEVRIIQLSNIGEEGWRDENTKYTTFEHLKEISRSEVMPNDIVIAKMMPAGRAILCPAKEPKYVLSSDAVKFHLKESIENKYVLFAINSSTFREQVYESVQGVTRVRTSLQKLRKYLIPLPPRNEQKRIVSKIEELFAILDDIKESLES